jgi:hypothetical protein
MGDLQLQEGTSTYAPRTRYYNRYRIISLALMLAPYGAIGALAADAGLSLNPGNAVRVVKLADLERPDAVPHLYAGATIMLQQAVIVMDPSRTIR